MRNLFIHNLNEKDADSFTSETGLMLRRNSDKIFKKMCRVFTKAHILYLHLGEGMTDEEYSQTLDRGYIPSETYDIRKNKNNIIVERYPVLKPDEPYIFVCNHTCPEDIETVLNVLDRNAYLVLGSIESLRNNPEMYLSFLNGMIPFDILDQKQRRELIPKMERVLQTNSILIFPEGSHNYNPNLLINPLYDGPVNVALSTNRKIVLVAMLKDQKKNISYIDISNPLDVKEIKVNLPSECQGKKEKAYVQTLSSTIRNKMATAVYAIMERHFPVIERNERDPLEERMRSEKISEKIEDAFRKLKWNKDVFEAEYLTKKTKADQEHGEVVSTLSHLAICSRTLDATSRRYWIQRKIRMDKKNVVMRMREHLANISFH